MKKAQILSAIALAFALGLGVVAPVANTYAVCADVTVRTETKATKQEGTNAVAYVKRNATYNKIAKVAAAIAEYYGTDGTDSTNGINPALTATAGTIKTAMDNLNAIAGISSTYNSGETDLSKLAINASATTNYSLFANLVHDIATATATDNATNRQKIIDDIRALNGAKDTEGNAVATVDLSTYNDTTTLATLTSATTGITNYNTYKTLIDLVDNVNNYAAAYDAIAPAIAAAVDTTAGKTASDANEKFTTTIAALVAEAVNANITGYTNWANVYIKAADVEKDITESARYTAIVALATAWKAALPDTECTAAVIAEQMMGTPAPAEGDNNQGDNNGDTNNGSNAGDDTQDPSAPGTGLVGTAEGNAATTVSIVAGLATALTALGAGVVAYRSARRSNK